MLLFAAEGGEVCPMRTGSAHLACAPVDPMGLAGVFLLKPLGGRCPPPAIIEAPIVDPERTGMTCLIIVARDRPDLQLYLMQTYGGIEGFRVLLDRRQGTRRQRVQSYSPERRQGERRRPPTSEHDLRRQPLFLASHQPPAG